MLYTVVSSKLEPVPRDMLAVQHSGQSVGSCPDGKAKLHTGVGSELAPILREKHGVQHSSQWAGTRPRAFRL
jgi:hypothetical protein